ncbi:MAG: hypothetical protein IKU69_00130 [Roseburia sp.]|nr:hypothetical protein [Roseburia sp.]
MADCGFYIGIDIDDAYAVTSYITAGMAEPATVSMVAGSEVYQTAVPIAAKSDSEELNAFVRKLISYACAACGKQEPDGLAITVPSVTREIFDFYRKIEEAYGISSEKCLVMDHKSAFYYFVMSQKEDLWLHDVCLYDYNGNQMQCLRLERNLSTEPQLVTIDETIMEMSTENQDDAFYELLLSHMNGHIISSVYLVGNAFDGGWMQNSLNYMCRGRRAFIGKNLYAKGACYGMLVSNRKVPWKFAYLGDNEMKANVNLKVRNCGKEEFYTLLSAGDNRYEAGGSCEVIADDTNEVAVWMQLPNSREAKVEVLTLSDLPERENRTTRLQIVANPVSDIEVCIQIKDMGFGEIVKSSNLTWEYIMSCIQ